MKTTILIGLAAFHTGFLAGWFFCGLMFLRGHRRMIARLGEVRE